MEGSVGHKIAHVSRIIGRTLLWTIVGIMALAVIIPALLYVPSIQNWAKDTALGIVRKSTGMDIDVGHISLRFPLKIQVDDIMLALTPGDTMVTAGSASLTVKPLPLLKLDIDISGVSLDDVFYRMGTPDSAMWLTARVRRFDLDATGLNLKTGTIDVGKAMLDGGSVNLVIRDTTVTKAPTDTAKSKPWRITAEEIALRDLTYSMSMLPTIDSLGCVIASAKLADAVVDLGTAQITAESLTVASRNITYLLPENSESSKISENYEESEISENTQPWTITASKIIFTGDTATYAVRGAVPAKGLDMNYLQATAIEIEVDSFYNRLTDITVPLRKLSATERCGVSLRADGTFAMADRVMYARQFNISTGYSSFKLDADMGIGDMASDPDLPLRLLLDGTLSLEDVTTAMPSLEPILRGVPRNPAIIKADINGTTGSIDIDKITASIPRFLSFKASGLVSSPFNIDKIGGRVTFNVDAIGLNAVKPTLLEAKLAKEINIPATRIAGTVNYSPGRIAGNASVVSGGGNIGLDARWVQRAESYDASLKVNQFPVGAFMPAFGIGTVTANFAAKGKGYNPLSPKTDMDIRAEITDIAYMARDYRDIILSANLAGGDATGQLRSTNPDADLDFDFRATVADSGYTWNLAGKVHHLDPGIMKLTASPMSGSMALSSDGSCDASMKRINADLKISDLNWAMSDMKFSTKAIDLDLVTTDSTVTAMLNNGDLNAKIVSLCGLDSLLAHFTSTSAAIDSALVRKNLDVVALQRALPPLSAIIDMGTNNIVGSILADRDMSFKSVQLSMNNDSLFNLGADALFIKSGKNMVDTVNLGLVQHGKYLAYSIKANNRPGTMDNFAHINLNGFIANDRATALLRQSNIKGEQGFMLGLSATMADSAITVKLVPYNPTIGYKKWTLNNDNFVYFNFVTKHIDANLAMHSDRSYIKLFTEHVDSTGVADPSTIGQIGHGQEDIVLQLSEIELDDWLSVSPFAPPIKGALSADMRFRWNASEITGKGNVALDNLYYGRDRVGSFDVGLDITNTTAGTLQANASLMVDSVKVITAMGHLNDSTAAEPFLLDFSMIQFPLKVVNPFLPKEYARLSGVLNGQMDITGDMANPIFNGFLDFDSTEVKVGMLGQSFRFSEDKIPVDSNVVRFKDFSITGANKNPLRVNGTVDARHLTDIRLDLDMKAKDMQVVNSSRASGGADVFGRAFLNVDASVKGNMTYLDVDATLNVLPGTNVTYIYETVNGTSIVSQSSEDMVRFVNFNDTTQVAAADSIAKPSMSMNLNANLIVSNGSTLNVFLSSNGGNRVVIQGEGNLNYSMSPLNDGRLTGRFNINDGNLRYSKPPLPSYNFNFLEGSYVSFNGDMMNPTINVKATELKKAIIAQSDQNSNRVDFLISLNVSGTLQTLNVEFDLSTDNDMTVQNELSSMTPQQRANQAMMLLAGGSYQGPNSKSADQAFNLSKGLSSFYSLVLGGFNSWLANNVKGVDISFGIDQYNTKTDGARETTTSYSYRVSKSLFNDRFKIVVGGNYSTDDNVDDNFEQNLINDISFEYMLNRNGSMIIRIFRHTGYESILEGEVTQTGVGFVYKHKLGAIRDMFRFLKHLRPRPKNNDNDTHHQPTDILKPDDIKATE